MNIGDKITVRRKAVTIRTGNKNVYTCLPITPIECIYLGVSHIYSGTIKGDSDYSYLLRGASHKVAVVQPLHKTRYLKPFYMPLEDES